MEGVSIVQNVSQNNQHIVRFAEKTKTSLARAVMNSPMREEISVKIAVFLSKKSRIDKPEYSTENRTE